MSKETRYTKKIYIKGFVIESTTFIILEDLSVKPDSFQNSVYEPMNLLRVENWHAAKLCRD